MNALLGYEDKTQTEEIYLAIRRLKRDKLSEQRQAVGINHDLLIKMIDAQPETLTGFATEHFYHSDMTSWRADRNWLRFRLLTSSLQMMAHSKVLSGKVKPTSMDVADSYLDLYGALNFFANGSGISQKIFRQSFVRLISENVSIDQSVTEMSMI